MKTKYHYFENWQLNKPLPIGSKVLVVKNNKTRFGEVVEEYEGAVLIKFRWLIFTSHKWFHHNDGVTILPSLLN